MDSRPSTCAFRRNGWPFSFRPTLAASDRRTWPCGSAARTEATMSARPDLNPVAQDNHIAEDLADLVSLPTVTGHERQGLELLAELGQAYGLEVDLHSHDLVRLRRHPNHPGAEVDRD